MMTNLFSVFDPSSTISPFPWILLLSLVGLTPKMLWKLKSPIKKINMKIDKELSKEISFSSEEKKSQEVFVLSLFTLIALMNFSALYPQVFSLSSHLSITLPLSLIFWVSVNSFGWTKNFNHMMSHLVPQGTPNSLMAFMVIIEMTSNLIRPITLCVRLTANMIAGHLLMTLLGNSLITLYLPSMTLSLLIPILLTILESAVAIIQSYVLMTLITLYMAETK